MRFHTTIHLSEHISKTPEGYLLCCDVPIARTGWLDYAASELPEEITQGQKTVRVCREASDLFAAEAVASYEGKPLTIEHPDNFVSPSSYRKESRGHVQNVRRGQGAEDDLLLADILVMDAEAISLVTQGLRELSCGYDADYETVDTGVVKQTNFVGNHVALVDRGRCGPRCAIKDSAGEIQVKGKNWFDTIMGNPKVRRAVRDAEAEEAKTGDEDVPAKNKDEESEVAPATDNANLMESLEEIKVLLRSVLEKQGGVADEDAQVADQDKGCVGSDEESTAKEPTADEEVVPTAKTGDRRTADADTLRRAGVLAPSLRFRVGDSAALVHRTALRSAMHDTQVCSVVADCLGRHTLDSAPAALLNAAFVAASATAARVHNKQTADALTGAKAKDKGTVHSPASINAANRDFYKK